MSAWPCWPILPAKVPLSWVCLKDFLQPTVQGSSQRDGLSPCSVLRLTVPGSASEHGDTTLEVLSREGRWPRGDDPSLQRPNTRKGW